MVIGSGQGNVVSCFFREDLGKVGVLRQERDFGLHFFSSYGKLRCCSEFGDKRGVWKEMFAIILEDSVNLAIVQGVLEVLILCIVVEVVVKV